MGAESFAILACYENLNKTTVSLQACKAFEEERESLCTDAMRFRISYSIKREVKAVFQ